MSTANDASTSAVKPARKALPRLLMWSLPLLLTVAGTYSWLTGGRYIETENALLQQPRLAISANLSGPVAQSYIRNNQRVSAGELLFSIDPVPYQLALNQARAALQQAQIEVEALRARFAQSNAEIELIDRDIDYFQTEMTRLQDLVRRGLRPQTDLDAELHNLNKARSQRQASEQTRRAALYALAGDPQIAAAAHPAVVAAQARFERAQYDLEQTRIYAPANGIIFNADSFHHGAQITKGAPLFSLVSTDRAWVEANFKETELTHMHPGQLVSIHFDAFPDRALTGRIAAIGAGTGSEFSLLPAQNATGNWVKVTQRVPVEIAFDQFPSELALRAGMSATVRVDTKIHRSLSDLFTQAVAATNHPE